MQQSEKAGKRLFIGPSEPLQGEMSAPGDKSISHRALILAALARGRSRLSGLSSGQDVAATAAALAALGVSIEKTSATEWQVEGRGPGGLAQPDGPIYLGNSGTSARLLMGLLASQPFSAVIEGDASLSRRPMERAAVPLREMGAMIETSSGHLPLRISGSVTLSPIDFSSPVPSAQLKSAILIAGLGTSGATSVSESLASRDHSERLIARFGGAIRVEGDGLGGRRITLEGPADLRPQRLDIAGDFSSAAYPLVAALLVPGSEILIRGVGVNPTRTGLLDVLGRMGARVRLLNQRDLSGEPLADIGVSSGPLVAVKTTAGEAPGMIDEFPILFVAAALAKGQSRFEGLGELRFKESDRLEGMAQLLKRAGVRLRIDGEALEIEGGVVVGGVEVDALGDHRLAMSAAVLGMVSAKGLAVTGSDVINTSYPAFFSDFGRIGAEFQELP